MPSLSSFTSFFSSQPAPAASQSVLTYTTQHKVFNPNTASDVTVLTNSTTTLTDKLAELQDLDKHIITGFAVGTTAFALSSLLPFGVTMAIAGFGYSAYYIGQRAQLAMEYRVALSDAVACLKWTLGDVDKKENKDAILQSTQVKELFDTLSPLMSEPQLRAAIDNTVEDDLVVEANEKTILLFGRTLNNQEKALVYGIYGYEQGGALDVGKGLWYLACQAITWVVDSVKGLWSSQEVPAPVADQPEPTAPPTSPISI